MTELISPSDVTIVRFPDGQPHIIMNESVAYHGHEVDVFWPIRNSDELLTLAMLSNALDHIGCIKKTLYIPYLLGARYDRIINIGDSLDLEVVCELIYERNFNDVKILDVHNRVATRRYIYFHHINNECLVKKYEKQDAVLIIPDKGAIEKAESYLEWNLNIKEKVFCEKSRDLSNGNITLNVINPEKCTDRHCVIIDDIYDGGGTFEAIAKQIKPKSLTVIVTHSIFSKGYGALEGDKPLIDHVITTDSFKYHNHPRIHVVSALEIMTKGRNYDR